MNKIRRIFKENWRSSLVPLVTLLSISGVYLFRVSSLTHNLLSNREADAHNTYQSFKGFVTNPINAPYRLIDYLFLHLHTPTTAFTRYASVTFGLLACLLFFIIIRRWHGQRSAIFTTILFAISGWMLHVTRLGTPDILFVLVPLVLVLLASWAHKTEKHFFALLCMSLIFGLLFYIPGAIWFVIATSVLIRKAIIGHIRNLKIWKSLILLLIILVALAPLVHAMYLSPHLIRSWLFLPSAFPKPITLLKQLAESITFLFARGPFATDLWLAHTPIFDIFTSVMCLLGVYFYVRYYNNLRSYTLSSFLIIGGILVGLNGVNAMGFVIPTVYLLVGTGLTYVLRDWLTVFPRNPVARISGILLVTGVIAIATTYHLESYFVAWRSSPNTVQVFKQEP